MQSKISGIKSI